MTCQDALPPYMSSDKLLRLYHLPVTLAAALRKAAAHAAYQFPSPTLRDFLLENLHSSHHSG